MSMRKTLSIVLLFVVIITSFRVIWYISLLPLHQPFAEQGVLDLSEFSLSDKDSVVLDGEWSFYPNAFATTEDQLIGQEEKTIKVPLGWNKVSLLPKEVNKSERINFASAFKMQRSGTR
ncbi:BH2012 [Halalkalibacterium halodurans C-125]|uniref:BH2012 protein n=1 Tax=Halalkalibacterium halodurans (strain ATCC BAA-125 / DSM 18197 / FERM 7344 / JCM 9153 / C-125) TaxID=272558 RepID=Q9KBB6_HALH5|nr:hypothetical protein [Halalkalibacterium halodurans]BAB05731.1 BH2012 [Halalkalibacterium halodurans C-125]